MSINNVNAVAATPRTADFSAAYNPTQLNSLVANLVYSPPAQLPRVLSQNPAAGLIVPQGTTIHVTLTQVQYVPIDVFNAVPATLTGKTVGQILPALTPAVQSALARGVPATSLSDAERQAIRTALQPVAGTVTDAQVDQAMVDTLRNAALFL
jgi:hypothetical protein